MTFNEGVLGRAGARAERARKRKPRHRQQVGSARKAVGNRVQARGSRRQPYQTTISLESKPKLRIPSLGALRSGARIPALMLLCITVWGFITIYSAPDFQVAQAEIIGLEYLSPSRIRTIAGTKGQSIFKMDPVEIEKELEMLPEVERAIVKVYWPNKVVIQIKERQPVLAWNEAGQTWVLSADGLASYQRSAISGLVHVHSLTAVLNIDEPLVPVIEKEKIKAAYELSLLLGKESPLLYDARHGFGFRDERGWMAYFGFSGDMAAKLKVYELIANELTSSGYPATLVSVEDLQGPFYR